MRILFALCLTALYWTGGASAAGEPRYRTWSKAPELLQGMTDKLRGLTLSGVR